MDQEDKDEELSDEELERKLDVLWNNWESRRQCEKKHIPNYLKKEKRNE